MPVLSGAAGLISGLQIPQVDALIKECRVQSIKSPEGASEYCNKIPDYISQVSGGVDLYNISELDEGLEGPYKTYLNRE